MISSVFTLKQANYIPNELASIKETKIEENYYTNSTLKFLLECQEDLLVSRQDFYKSILEAENKYIVNESFDQVLNTLKTIIKKILAFIETLVKKFVTQLAKYINSDKYISSKAIQEQIKKFPKNQSFIIDGYNFTFNDKIPVIDLEVLNLLELNRQLDDIYRSDDIVNSITNLTLKVSEFSNENKMNDIRGQILNVDYSISETEFENQLFSIFRDNKSEKGNIVIRHANVMKSLDDYKEYSKKSKDAKYIQSEIDHKYSNILSQIDLIRKNNSKLDGSSKFNEKINSNMTNEDSINKLKTTLDTMLITLANQINRIANLHVIAFAKKLDAYNEAIMQDRNILYKALSIVQSDINNTYTMGAFKESLDLSIDENTEYDYTRELQYKEYLLEKHEMNLRQKRFVEECLVLSESNVPELRHILEDLNLDTKNNFEKMKDLIMKIFNKFKEKINSFFERDKKFLEENKKAILTKLPDDKKYTINNMPPYSLGIQNIESGEFPKTSTMDKLIPLSEEDVRKTVLPKYDGNGEFSEFAKRFFLCDNGENKDRESTDQEVDMAKIYEFCINHSRVNIISKGVQLYNSEVSKVASYLVSPAVKKESAFNDLGIDYIYSTVLETFISEADVNDTKSQAETTINKNNNANNTAKDGVNLKMDVDDNDKKETNKSEDKQDGDTTTKEEKSKTNKKAMETAKWYLKALQVCITAKMTAYQKIYKEYMDVIRYHVDVINGKSNDNQEGNKDQTKLKNALDEYKNADTDDAKKVAAEKIKTEYKALTGKTLDDHGVQIFVKKNS